MNFKSSPLSMSDVLGILGFVLSLTLALIAAMQNRIQMSISEAELYPMEETTKGKYFFIRFILSNKSRAPLSISQITLNLCEHIYVRAMKGEQLIMGNTRKDTSSGTCVRSELTNTQFPINLNPQESREIYVVFHLQSSEVPQDSLPLWLRNHPEPESTPCVQHVSALFYTHRRPIQRDFDSEICDYKTLSDELSERNLKRLSLRAES